MEKNRKRKFNIVIWDKYNKLVILKEFKNIEWVRYLECKCECWNIKDIRLFNIVSWLIKSCWCWKKLKWNNNPNYKHWECSTKIYSIFKSIEQRCYNKNNKAYKWYWWRWIKCEWSNFEDFKKDMFVTYKEWLQIDRIDNNSNYSRYNCRWVTSKQNNNNRRSNHLINFKWEIKTIMEWSELTLIPRTTINNRLLRWRDINDIFLKNNNNGYKYKTYKNTEWLY